jgi:D-alanine-D-alanine ligase
MILVRKLRVAILFGGVSSEHEVSLMSAKSVIEHIPRSKYEVIMVGITKKGEWKLYKGPVEKLTGSHWEEEPGDSLPAFISPDTKQHGLIVLHADGHFEMLTLDAVFPVMHGANGEDGTMQGLLTLAQLPFVGCGVTASALCMDKSMTKAVLDTCGIAQAKWDCARVEDFEKDGASITRRIVQNLGYPIFVKPANAGSSVGISKAENEAELYKAIEAAAKHDKKLVFEEAVKGREIECAVLGGSEPVASCCGEIVPDGGFYDYEAKYITNGTKLLIPAPLPEETANKVRETAVKVFKLLGCEGLTRMDFFVREADGAVLLNEPNTIPGFTSISMYPKLFEASGIPYGDLLDSLIRMSVER